MHLNEIAYSQKISKEYTNRKYTVSPKLSVIMLIVQTMHLKTQIQRIMFGFYLKLGHPQLTGFPDNDGQKPAFGDLLNLDTQ